jgi:RimJ/RimL family protein N-acetyltransferase
MPAGVFIETERLFLRDWRDGDAEPFSSLNADLRVMEFFPKPLNRPQSDAFMARIRAFIGDHGYGLYAVEEKLSGAFLGYIGLAPVRFEAPFTPATEIGWRLARTAWGSGYATEGARAVLYDAFGRLKLRDLVSFTAEWNTRSRRVMEKIGMRHDAAGSFLHPLIPPEHKLALHVLYRIEASDVLNPIGDGLNERP